MLNHRNWTPHVLVLAIFILLGARGLQPTLTTAQAPGPCAPIPSGNTSITSNVSWCPTYSPYIISTSQSIAFGGVLTIEPGVTVKFAPATHMFVNGTLIAAGTSIAPIIFTTTINAPPKGAWGRIVFDHNSFNNLLEYVTIEYGGGDTLFKLLESATSSLTINNSIFRHSAGDAIYLDGASPSIHNSVFEDNLGSALVLEYGSQPDLSGLTAQNNGFDAVTINHSSSIATPYTWGAGGISTYRLLDSVSVSANSTLTIAPGTTVRLAPLMHLFVNGSLQAAGTSSAPIRFTNLAGTSTKGSWGRLRFEASSLNNLLEYVTIEYGGSGNPGQLLDSSTSSLTIRNSTFRGSAGDGIYLYGPSPIIHDSLFEDNVGSALRLEFGSQPDLSGLTAQGNGFDAVTINISSSSATPYTWGAGGISTYRVLDSFTIRSNNLLTIAPGTTVQMASSASLFVDGSLIAPGTSTAPITFTGVVSPAVKGSWRSIVFNGTSNNNLLDHVTVAYGGANGLPAVRIETSKVAIRNTTITNNDADAVRVTTGTPTIVNTNLVANGGAGVLNDGAGSVVATCNWWDAASGPTNSSNPGGTGQAAVGTLTFDPGWLLQRPAARAAEQMLPLPPPPTVTATNATTGASGSYFVITAANFTPNTLVTIAINERQIFSATIDASGGFSFVLFFGPPAPAGTYTIRVAEGAAALSANLSAQTQITIDPEAKQLAYPGGVPVINAFPTVYLPVVKK